MASNSFNVSHVSIKEFEELVVIIIGFIFSYIKILFSFMAIHPANKF